MAVRRIPLAVALFVAALGCERSEPPAHLSRLRDMRRDAPPTWDASKLGLCPQSPDADAIAAAPPGSGAAAGIVCSLSLRNYRDTAYIKSASDEAADMDVTARLGTDTGPYIVELRNETGAPINIDDEKRIFEVSLHVRSTSRELDSRLATPTAPAVPDLPPGGAIDEVYLLDGAAVAPDQVMLNLSVQTSEGVLPWSLAID